MMIRAKALLTQYLNPAKAEHCFRVAECAREIASAHQQAPDKAYLAGLLHDIARGIPGTELIRLAKENKVPIEDHEQKHPILLHGKVGAVIVRSKLGITDKDVLAAIENHTLGRHNMSYLEKVIYVADFAEPGRYMSESKNVYQTALQDLDRAVAEKAKAVLKYAEQNGMHVGEFQKEAASGS
jgi:nicotinate-nucleotide adenylyltransferase